MRRAPVLLLGILAMPAGCGGGTGSPADAAVDVTTPATTDAANEAATPLADAAADVRIPLVIDAGIPAPCEAGDFYVTIDNGASTVVLRDGCAATWPAAIDSGPEPYLGPYAAGRMVEPSTYLSACAPGTTFSVTTQLLSPPLPVGSTYEAASGYDNGDGGMLVGTGTIVFTSAPPDGETVAGSYAQSLTSPDGGYAGNIAGTFCVLLL